VIGKQVHDGTNGSWTTGNSFDRLEHIRTTTDIPSFRASAYSERRMTRTWAYIYVASTLILGSMLLARRKRPRDLHRAPPGQNAYYRWTRTAGIGLTFGSLFEAVAALWRGEATSGSMLLWMLLGITGLSTWFRLSESIPQRSSHEGEADAGSQRCLGS
jgi:hypothetical protein